MRKVLTLLEMEDNDDRKVCLDYLCIDVNYVEEQRSNLLSKHRNLVHELNACKEQLLVLKQAKLYFLTLQHVNTEILKENKNLTTELKELKAITETWLNNSSSSGQKDLVFVKYSADNTKVTIPGVERPWLSEAEGFILPNHDTGRILPSESQRNTTDPSVAVTDSSATDYDSADESSVCSTPLPPLKKLDGVEPISGPKTIKSILRKPIWYLDSGCSRHMTGVKSYLHKYVEQLGPKVVFGDDSTCTTEGYGSIKCNGIVFTKVAFVNGLKYNLISISQLCDAKYNVQFDEKRRESILTSNKEIVMIAPRVRDVYVLDITSSAQESCFFAKASKNLNWLWHKRLAHLNFKTINKLAKQNLVIGLPSLVYSKDKPCSSCEKGKHHRASSKTKQTSSIKKCLHLIHMDLFGPVTPRSINHEKYTLVIVDEYSRKQDMPQRAIGASDETKHQCHASETPNLLNVSYFVDFLSEEEPKKYSAIALENSKVSFSIPTSGIFGEVGVNTFRNAIGAHYLTHSGEYVALPSIDVDRQWFLTIRYEEEVSAKDKLVVFKAPKPSSIAEGVPQGINPGAQPRHKNAISLKQPSVQEKSQLNCRQVEEGKKPPNNQRRCFPTSSHSPVQKVITGVLEKNEAEAALFKAQPSFPNVEELNKLLVKSLKTKLSNILSTHDFSSSILTELKNLPSKFIQSTEEVAEMKTLQWELPQEYLSLPRQVTSVQAKLKTLDALLGLLSHVTKALNKFAHVLDFASSKAGDQSVPSAGQADTMPAEGENNTNQATIF
ncbi:retrovirus-related pol polyprotein from transposon TNT 1-94 [Tanacetum coccineum]